MTKESWAFIDGNFDANLNAVIQKKTSFTAVSSYLWFIDPNGNFSTHDWGGYTPQDITSQILTAGLEAYPLISNNQRNPSDVENLLNDKVRRKTFRQAVVNAVVANNASGVCIDFEGNLSTNLTRRYMNLLNQLAIDLHSKGKKLASAWAKWITNLCDFTMLPGTTVDYILQMSSYPDRTVKDPQQTLQNFEGALNYALQYLAPAKLAVGLCPFCNLSASQPVIDQEFAFIKTKQLQVVMTWVVPLPQNYYPLLATFLSS